MKKLLILFGGQSNEHEISCESAKNIISFIDQDKYIIEAVLISKEGDWFITENMVIQPNNKIDNIINFLKSFDVVFPVLHGEYGEDGRIQGLLDIAGVKYVGSSLLSSSMGLDKHFSKVICTHLGIPTLPYFLISGKYKIKDIEKTINYPMIIKPVNSGSSIGIYIAKNKNELNEKIKLAQNINHKLIIEPFIKVRELECAVLENKKINISRVGEIIYNSEFYDYNTKYKNNDNRIVIPAKLEKKIEKKIQEYAKKFFIGIEASGLARIDFFLDENSNIYFNEINSMPGFTDQSMFPKLLENSGFTQKEIISTLIDFS